MYNIALFGAGRIAEVHAENIARHPNCQIRFVVDPIASAAEKLANRYDAEVSTVETALADSTVHAVVIVSSTDTHAHLIEESAKARKAIFCEKPIDLNLERVKSCLQIVEEYKVPLLVGFNRRFDPQFATLRTRYRQDMIGAAETLLIISRDPTPPPAHYVARSGGLFRDMMIHDFDMVRFILGENPIKVSATGSCLVDKEIGLQSDIDTATVTLAFASGKQAVIINSRRSGYGYDQRLELHGERGLLKANNILENEVQQFGATQIISARPMDFFLQRYADAYRIEWQHFVDVLEGKAKVSVDGSDGEWALRLADAAQSSLKKGLPVSL